MSARPLRFVRLDIEGFGCLAGSYSLDLERVNLIAAPNEEGKSTLAHALLAVLYGLERDRRKARSGVLELDRFRPWTGASYAATLEIERGGRRLTIRRDFERDDLTVRDGAGADVTREYRTREGDRVGKKLTGLTRGEFERTVFSGHDEMQLAEICELKSRLQSIASAEQSATPERARASLEDALAVYAAARAGTVKVETEIKRLQKDLADASTEIRRIEEERERLHESFEAVERRTARLRELESERARENFLALRADLEDAERALQQQEQLAAELAGLIERRDALEDAASFPSGQSESLTSLRTEALGYSKSIAAKKEERTSLEGPLEAARQRFAELGRAGEATPDHRSAVLRVRDRLAEIGEESEKAVRAHMDEKSKLVQRGMDPAETERLEASFGALTAEERALAGSEEEFRKASAADRRAVTERSDRARLTMEGVRRSRAETRWWAVVLLIVGLAVCAVSFLAPSPGRFVALALGAGLVLAGVAVFIFSFSRASDALAKARQEAHEASRAYEELSARIAEHDRLAGALAKSAGFADPLEMSHAYAKWFEAYADVCDFKLSDRRLSDAMNARKAVLAEAESLATRWGVSAEGEPVTERALAELAERMQRALAVREEIAGFERDLARVRREIADEEGRLATATGTTLDLLRRAGIEASAESLDEAVKEFMNRRGRHEDWEKLENTAIPAARRALRGETWIEAQRARVAALRESVSKSGRPEWDALPAGSAEDHRQRADRCVHDARDLQAEVHAVEQKVSAFLEHEQPRMAPLLAQREDLIRCLRRAQRFEGAVTLARDLLAEVSHETFASWSDALNGIAAEMIPRAHHGIEAVRFLEDLGVSVRVPGGRELSSEQAEAQLSAGARDQLVLLVRLAVSEYLSRGEALLPLVLDDPFARTDDERFDEAFRFLIERCAGRHQLLVFTCHEGRHAALEAKDPGWFEARVARVALGAASAHGLR